MFVQNVGYGLVELRVSDDECALLAALLQVAVDALVLLPGVMEEFELTQAETMASLLTQAGTVARWKAAGAETLMGMNHTERTENIMRGA